MDSSDANSKALYLDNAATTAVSPSVSALVAKCMGEEYGNPSSAHHLGIKANDRVCEATEAIAAGLGDKDSALGSVVFTSGGTEADAMGVIGAARSRSKKTEIVVSALEHPAVLESAWEMTRENRETKVVAATKDGVVTVESVLEAVTDQTAVVAIMLVNNELGSILPLAKISRAIRERYGDEVHIHCDAVQAFGKIALSVGELGIDSLAMSAHKIHGPKGVGALWLRKGARIRPLWYGGGQQRGIRSGTLNVPGIAGFGLAALEIESDRPERTLLYQHMRKKLLSAAQSSKVEFRENAADAPGVPHILSMSFKDVPSESLLNVLESRGVLVSAGSACAERSRKPSKVLQAISLPKNYGTLRFSFGRCTTSAEVDKAADILHGALRSFA